MYNSVITVIGNGTTTTFSYPHGLSGSAFGGFAQANTAARNFPVVTKVDADSTNVNLHFDVAPANGAVQNFNVGAFYY